MSEPTDLLRVDPTDIVWDWRITLNHNEIVMAEDVPQLDPADQAWEWLISPNHNEILVHEG
jgi:hypothetical protein